jgi:hypothetical protein
MPRRKRAFKQRRKIRHEQTEGTPNDTEVRLLSKGFVPQETKFGTPFRGKNKVIIAQS